jgi:outer membrane protein assembly factor BamB
VRNIIPLGVLLSMTSTGAAADWPQWLGAKRDGSSTEVVKPWKEPLKILWKEPIGEGDGAPVIVKGKVFLHTRTPGKYEESVAAFAADTGKPIWKTPYPRKKADFLYGSGPRGACCVADGKVYAFGITGVLSCFDADKGTLVWQVDTAKKYQAPTPFFGNSCSPIVEGGLVLVNVGAKGASIVAFDKDTGKEAWKKLDDKASYSSPIAIGAADARQVIFLTANGLVSLDPKDGAIYWQHPLKDKASESSTTPVVVGDFLFGASITLGGISLKMENADGKPSVKQAWKKPELTCYFSTPVAVGKDHLYLVTSKKTGIISFTSTLRCIEAATGNELWKRDKVGEYHASLLRTGDDKLLLVEEFGDLVLLDANPKEYRELARSKICGKTWAHPALANGRLYIRDAKELICVELPK